MKQYIYADGMTKVSLSGGMVRLDLFHYTGGAEDGQAELPKDEDMQLVMPPAAFMRAFDSMQRFVAELEKKGLVQRGAAVRPQALPQESTVSPNFE